MYKPGNVSRPPPVVVPHQPRLDWQMWFAALGPHTHSPWFTSLVLCLLQGKEPGKAGFRGVGGGACWRGGALWAGLKELPVKLSSPPHSDPPHSERCGQVPLPQAAAQLRAGPALQVLVLTAGRTRVRLGHWRHAGELCSGAA